MPSLIYAVDGMNAIKLADEVFACLDSLRKERKDGPGMYVDLSRWVPKVFKEDSCAVASKFELRH